MTMHRRSRPDRYPAPGKLLLLWVLLLPVLPIAGQENLDAYYRYPFSVGGGYAPLQPVSNVQRRAAVDEISVQARLPLAAAPSLQPFALFGLQDFDSDEPAEPTVLGGRLAEGASLPDYDEQATWDHRKFFGGLGFGYARRIRKEFEVGADLFFALRQSYFDRRVVTEQGEWYPVGALGMIAGASGSISLNPSFNLSIDITPALRYERSFGALADFNGLYFGLGLGASYRFGTDPDSPQAEIRALEFGEVEMPAVFAAMQSVYVNEPITTFTLSNSGDDPVEDVEVTFNQPQFMDAPTQSAQVDEIPPGESVEVPLHGSFNQEVFFTNGITPVNGEIAVSYRYNDRPATQSQSVAFDLHDRNAMTWDDDRKVCAFITPSDSAIGNYASFIRSSSRNESTQQLPDSLEFGMQVYHALAALGILYQPDPTSPFTEVQGNTFQVDSVSLPRETLVDITGDCDDITVLFNALLESTGVDTGIVTIPGHIYSAIDTGLSPREFARIHPDRNMTIEIDGSLWVFVEITLIGERGFLEAWRTGMDQWWQYDDSVSERNFYRTAAAQEEYRPVGLRETDLGLQYGQAQAFIQPYRRDLNRLADLILEPLRERAAGRNRARDWNQVGIVAARLNQPDRAEDALERAARLDRGVSPEVNLGSLRFLEGEYRAALAAFRDAEEALAAREAPARTRLTVYINLARTLYELERFDEATGYVSRAEEIDPEQARRYQFIAAAGSETEGAARASGAAEVPEILFLETEEEDS